MLERCGIWSENNGQKWPSIFLRLICESISLEHSQFAYDLRLKTEWFQPTEGEFLALFTFKERERNFRDNMTDSSKNINDLFILPERKLTPFMRRCGIPFPRYFEMPKRWPEPLTVGRGRYRLLSRMECIVKRD